MKNIHIIIGGETKLGQICPKIFNKNDIVIITGKDEKNLDKLVYNLHKFKEKSGFFQCSIENYKEIEALFNYCERIGNIKTIVNCSNLYGLDISKKKIFLKNILGIKNLIDIGNRYSGKFNLILISPVKYEDIKIDENIKKVIENPEKERAFYNLEKTIYDNKEMYDLGGIIQNYYIKKNLVSYGERGKKIISISTNILGFNEDYAYGEKNIQENIDFNNLIKLLQEIVDKKIYIENGKSYKI